MVITVFITAYRDRRSVYGGGEFHLENKQLWEDGEADFNDGVDKIKKRTRQGEGINITLTLIISAVYKIFCFS